MGLRFTRTLAVSVLVFFSVSSVVTGQSRRCFVDNFDFVWDLTEVDETDVLFFVGTVFHGAGDVRDASGIYDPANGGQWAFSSSAGEGPAFVYSLSPDSECCDGEGAWVNVTPFESNGFVTVDEISCVGVESRVEANDSASLDRLVPGELRSLERSLDSGLESQQTGSFCLEDSFDYLWELEVFETLGDHRYFVGQVTDTLPLSLAVGIGSGDREHLVLASDFERPYIYNIAWDGERAGEGAWVRIGGPDHSGVRTIEVVECPPSESMDHLR